ncbi:MAG: nucleoside deaminase [Bacilli bacterium]|nr:nucleoside deaminase [Bacillales bacterium]MDY2574621.1 nucleoside deaminase [Bacilli bacterium]
MNKFMKIAIKEAQKGIRNNEGGPFGSVIVKDGKVLSKAHNQVLLKHDATCHGEMQAIRKASKRLKSFNLEECEIYTTGEPCPMCLGAILWSNIKKVYYGCNIVDTEEIGFRDNKFYNLTKEEKASFINELDREECLKLYEEYKNIEDKKEY